MKPKNSDNGNKIALSTSLIHSARDTSENYGCVNNGLFDTSTIIYKTYQDFLAKSPVRMAGEKAVSYGRHGNKTVFDLEDGFKAYSGAEYAFATSSGQAAISAAIFAFVRPSCNIVVVDNAYEPTRNMGGVLAKFGVEMRFIDPRDPHSVTDLVDDNTTAVFLESPGSLTFEMCDIPLISTLAKEKNPKVTVMIDNTWATCLNFDGFANGADIVIESCTKYICGHSDVLCGMIAFNDKRLWNPLRQTLTDFPMVVSGKNAHLALRGIRTLGARLKASREVFDYVYEGLKKRNISILHPVNDQTGIFKKYYTGHTSLFTIQLNQILTQEETGMFINSLKFFDIGYSWGGYESLILPLPNLQNIRTKSEIYTESGSCFRIYLGLEEPADLLADLENGLTIIGY